MVVHVERQVRHLQLLPIHSQRLWPGRSEFVPSESRASDQVVSWPAVALRVVLVVRLISSASSSDSLSMSASLRSLKKKYVLYRLPECSLRLLSIFLFGVLDVVIKFEVLEVDIFIHVINYRTRRDSDKFRSNRESRI